MSGKTMRYLYLVAGLLAVVAVLIDVAQGQGMNWAVAAAAVFLFVLATVGSRT